MKISNVKELLVSLDEQFYEKPWKNLGDAIDYADFFYFTHKNLKMPYGEVMPNIYHA